LIQGFIYSGILEIKARVEQSGGVNFLAINQDRRHLPQNKSQDESWGTEERGPFQGMAQ
jgi:hypothetical protein